MGLGSEVAKATILVKADTSDAKAKLRDLRGEERKRHQALLDEMTAQNKRIDDQIAFWGKMALSIGAAVGAFKLAQGAAKAYLEDVRLESAATGASLAGLERATRGLIEQDDLLAFAGKAMNGVWKLNQQEMETVLRGATALRKTMGVELQPTVQALTEAVAKGSTRALKEFGIEAKDKEGVLKQLGAAWESVGGKVGMVGDATERTRVRTANAFDDLQGKLGEMVVAMTPAIESVATFVDHLTEAVNWLQTLADSFAGGGNIWDRQKWMSDQAQAGALRQQAADLRAGRAGDALSNVVAGFGNLTGGSTTDLLNGPATQGFREALARDLERQAEQLEAGVAAAYAKTAKKVFEGRAGAQPGKKPARSSGGGYNLGAFELEGVDSAAMGFVPSAIGSLGGPGGIDSMRPDMRDADLAATLAGLPDAIAELQQNVAAFRKAEQDTILTQIFGTPAEIDAQVEAIRLASDMFGVFSTAAGEAYDVLISGSGSAMAAFQKAIAGGVAAMGKEMFVKGLSESAWAIADLARGNFAGAAGHGEAAAAFFGGAIVAGVTANALGYGSSGASPAAGGGAPSVLSGRRDVTPAEPSTINVYVGSEWASLSAQDQAGAINRAIQLGKRGSRSIRRH